MLFNLHSTTVSASAVSVEVTMGNERSKVGAHVSDFQYHLRQCFPATVWRLSQR
jgi:hypothetical protein